jgi:hypothetical protein
MPGLEGEVSHEKLFQKDKVSSYLYIAFQPGIFRCDFEMDMATSSLGYRVPLILHHLISSSEGTYSMLACSIIANHFSRTFP